MVEKSLRALVLEDEDLTADRRVELLRYMTLPHASQYCDLVVPWKGKIHIGLEDAKDFFYLLQMPEER
eukprot:6054441-Amphidinium_carterae.1